MNWTRYETTYGWQQTNFLTIDNTKWTWYITIINNKIAHRRHTTVSHHFGPRGDLCMHLANARRRYIATSSLIGWAHTQNAPCDRTKRWPYWTVNVLTNNQTQFSPCTVCTMRIIVEWNTTESWIVKKWMVKCEMKLLIHFQTSTVAPLKFRNRQVIVSHTL